MKLEQLRISNYRGLKSESIPLSEFVCLVGKNNSGKSSFLQCLSLLVSGTKIKDSDFYDLSLPVRIELVLGNITAVDLERVETEQHRERFENLLEDGRLRLVRIYDAETGKSSLNSVRRVPRDERLNLQRLKEIMTGKSGDELRSTVVEILPEMGDVLVARPTQRAIIDEVKRMIADLPDSELVESDEPLPTGLDRTITPLLPEVIYIPAVKDVTDEIKTTESATFGKLLRILFDQISEQFGDIQDQFAALQRKLSRVLDDGEEVDFRLPEVKRIEETIEKYVRNNFPDVKLKLKVPAPELRTVLNSAELLADDGYEGPITSKGDGLKRAVAFAVLQAYAELRTSSASGADTDSAGIPTHNLTRSPYVLLFEEPELYLHPAAQGQLFKALEVFAKDQTVIVTTHHPTFFSASSTKTFIKLHKIDGEDGRPPYAAKHVVDLSDMSARDQMQLIGYENNNAALFADRVALVEGDSDYIVFPHLGRTLLGPDAFAASGLTFVRVSGKGSLQRYRSFFESFGIKVFCIADLDVITNQFDKLGPTQRAIELRSALLLMLDAQNSGDSSGVSASQLGNIRRGGETRSLWDATRTARSSWESTRGEQEWTIFESAMDALFQRIEAPARYLALRGSTDPAVLSLKSQLLDELSNSGAHVLSLGCLEDYYPESLPAEEKVQRALQYCKTFTTQELVDSDKSVSAEFVNMFQSMFQDV